MAPRRRGTSLFIVLLGLGTALLSGDGLPQGYQTRFARSHRCPNCPPDCSEKLAGSTAELIIHYPPPKPAKPHYPAPPSSPHPTPASYVTVAPQPQPQYSAPPPQPQPEYHAPPPEPQPQYSAPPPQPQPQYSAPPPPPPQPQYTAPPPPQPQYRAPPPPAAQPYQPIQIPTYQTNYLPQSNPLPCACPDCPSGFDPYDYPDYECGCAGGCRCGRSIDFDDDEESYPMFGRYNRRSLQPENTKLAPKKEHRPEPLPFADESGPPADFYRNYRPFARESIDRREYESEEQPSRRASKPSKESDQRLFVVYRADAIDDKPSDSELESVIRQAMDVARQQKTQEDFALNGRKAKPANRFRYEHEKFQDAADDAKLDFQALKKKDAKPDGITRVNLSPGPLLSIDDKFVTDEGDDTLNPGDDQSKWTVVPSLTDFELSSQRQAPADDVDEIEAAVSVVPEAQRKKVPKTMRKPAVAGAAKLKKQPMETVEIEMNSDAGMTQMAEDVMQIPMTITEAAKFEGPVESPVTAAPTTYASA